MRSERFEARFSAAKSALLARIRARGRRVVWTPAFMGFGNVLMLIEDGWRRSGLGERTWVRETAALTPWLAPFPGLRPFTIAADQVRFTDRRLMPWRDDIERRARVGYPDAIDPAARDRFVATVLLPGSGLAGVVPTPQSLDTLAVNVRRGDYYSNPEIRSEYGFDVAGFVREAVQASVRRDGTPAQIRLVSDDLDWCRDHLGWLDRVAEVVYPQTSSPVADFGAVATAGRIVASNSTFSYWAASVSTLMSGDGGRIWVPRFFDRTRNGGRSWLLDPRWSVVEEIPGGWDHIP